MTDPRKFYVAWSRQLCRHCYAWLPDMDLRLPGRDCGIKGSIPVEFLNHKRRAA